MVAQDTQEGPSGLQVHIAKPSDGQWLFLPSNLEIQVVLLYHGVIAHEQNWEVHIFVDGELLRSGRSFMEPITLSHWCLDPEAVEWRTGCAESDMNSKLTGNSITQGPHTIVMHVSKPGSSHILQSLQLSYVVVSPPQVHLSFPAPGQQFVCDGALTMMFSFDTDYEPTAEFYEKGASIQGAAAIINHTRTTISDSGFITTPPLAHGLHHLRVALFDHAGNEISGSTSTTLEISVSPPPASAGGSSGMGGAVVGNVRGVACQIVWLRPDHDEDDVALATLAAAAKPWLAHATSAHMREQQRVDAERERGKEEGVAHDRGQGARGRFSLSGDTRLSLDACPALHVVAPPPSVVAAGGDEREVRGIVHVGGTHGLWRLEVTHTHIFKHIYKYTYTYV
jgi:hypothetical protein